MASSLRSLKKAMQPSPVVVPPRNDYFVPLFTQSEIDEMTELKVRAESYSKYGGPGWFELLLEEEKALASDSLEGCIDSLEVLCDHWNRAIEDGKILEERAFCHHKAIMMAHTLEEHGLVEMKTAQHYLECVMRPSVPLGMSLIRMKDIISEFQAAFNQKRRVCMCNV